MGNEASKKLILARRARFVATALTGVATAATLGSSVDACGGSTDSETLQGVDGGADRNTPQPCLGATADPQPCLSPRAPDAGPPDANVKDAGNDAEPQPCLAPRLEDGG